MIIGQTEEINKQVSEDFCRILFSYPASIDRRE